MTKIEWTDTTENPIYIRSADGTNGGHWCQKISLGCTNCYAERINNSGFFSFASGLEYTGNPPESLTFDESIVEAWAKARSPKKRFVCSMTDLFGEWVHQEWQWKVFDAAVAAPKQTIQLLTKRPAVALESIEGWMADRGCPFPQNIWMGVTIEDQRTLNLRFSNASNLFNLLRNNVVWISYEPALSFVNFAPLFEACGADKPDRQFWLVLGGESGSGARKCDLDWLAQAIETAHAWNVKIFVKQMGARPILNGQPLKLVDRKGGDVSEFPLGLQKREFPAPVALAKGVEQEEGDR